MGLADVKMNVRELMGQVTGEIQTGTRKYESLEKDVHQATEVVVDNTDDTIE